MRPFFLLAAVLPAILLSACASTASPLPAQQEANRQVVLRFYEAGLNRKDADAALKYVGNRYVQHNPNAPSGDDDVITTEEFE